jgi:hypothetical protein
VATSHLELYPSCLALIYTNIYEIIQLKEELDFFAHVLFHPEVPALEAERDIFL